MSVKAVMVTIVALAVCLLPLFCNECSASSVITPGENGVSFDAGNISDKDFNDLFSDSYKGYFPFYALGAIDTSISHDEGGADVYDYEISDLEITDITEMKSAMGRKVTEDEFVDVYVRTIKCDISFTATRINCDGRLFTMRDGMQTLFKELDESNIITVGSVLKLDGELWVDYSEIITTEIVKNADNDYVMAKSTSKLSDFRNYTGNIDYTYTLGSEQVNKKYGASMEFSYGGTSVTTFDYLDTPVAEVIGTTKAIRTVDHSDHAYRYSYRYHIDDKADGYDYRLGAGNISKLTDEHVTAGTADEFGAIITDDIGVSQFSFYKEDGDMSAECLYNGEAIKDATCKSDAALKEKLGKLGNVGDTFSDAKSTADSAYDELLLNPVLRVDGLAAIVTITILATAVIILGIIIFKKK